MQTQEGWIKVYVETGALWIHDWNPKRPHALLTSGAHSLGFFNSELVMEDPSLVRDACYDLVDRLRTEGLDLAMVDRVVGPAMGAITLAHTIASAIAIESDHQCLRAYTEKEGEGESKLLVFKKTSIRFGERVLAVEDVLTTGGSVDLTTEAVTKAGGIVLPFVAVLVNRSGLTEVNGKKIVALINKPMPTWAPDECTLCKQGSEALRPKGAENWARLNAEY